MYTAFICRKNGSKQQILAKIYKHMTTTQGKKRDMKKKKIQKILCKVQMCT